MNGEDLAGCAGLAFLAIGSVFAMFRVARPQLGRKRYKDLDELVRDVAAITGLGAEPGWHAGLERTQFTGTLPGGRRAIVRYFTETAGSSTYNCVRLSVRAEDAPRLKVTEETLFTKMGKALGMTREIEIGDEPFDSRFLLQTDTPLKASRLLKQEVRAPIWAMFDLGARDLTFGGNEIVVTAEASRIEAANYRAILDALDRAAATLDRKPLPVRVLGGERRALLDDKGRTRCPYCRSNVTGDEPDLVACEKCGTVLHAGCWDEHGKCPLLGCTGRSPERARTR